MPKKRIQLCSYGWQYRLYGKWSRTCHGNNGYDKTSWRNPANFLDIGGSSNPVKVIEAMKLLLQDEKSKKVVH